MASAIPQSVTALDIDGKTHQVSTNDLTWRPSAYGVVIKDGKVLLLRQFNGHDLPGGGVEIGETPEEAVLREIKEESGIDATNPRLLGVHSSFFKLPHDEIEFVQSLMLYYVCDFVGGELSTDGFDVWEQQYAEAPEWWSIDKLDEITVATSHDFREYVRQQASA